MQMYIWNVQEELNLQEVIHNYIILVCVYNMASQSCLCITLFVRSSYIFASIYAGLFFNVTNEKLWGHKKEFLASSKYACMAMESLINT